MQLIAPFIHAHAFGLESHQAHTLHFHADETITTSQTYTSAIKSHVAELHQHNVIETPQVIGSVFKVASGVKRNLGFDIDAMLLTCIVVFGLFIVISKYFASPLNTLLYSQRLYSPHAPRAPPR